MAPGQVFDRVVCEPWTGPRVRVRFVTGDQVFVEERLGGVWTAVAQPFDKRLFLQCWVPKWQHGAEASEEGLTAGSVGL